VRSFGIVKTAILAFGFLALAVSGAHAQQDPQGVALLKKVTDAYKTASSFSCLGQYENDLQTAHPVKLMGTFKILFVRPAEIRIDWSDTKMGGEVVTNSIFTQGSSILFYWGLLGKVAAQKDMEAALSTAAGISHGLSYFVPSLLRGSGRILDFTSLKAPGSAVVDGTNCLVLSGTTHFQGDLEIAVDSTTYAIHRYQATKVIKQKDIQRQIEKARKEAAKTDPALAAKLHDAPAVPDFTSVMVATYQNPIFGPALTADAFVYPVPTTAKKVDKLF
jgi:hypothetical protein